MSDPAQNASLIRQFYDEVFNAGNIEFAQQVHGPGYRYHDITVSDAPLSTTTRTWPATLASRPRSLTGGWTSRT
jgi:predicted SnoaL-like aldol condensation-catalyzing enzyme